MISGWTHGRTSVRRHDLFLVLLALALLPVGRSAESASPAKPLPRIRVAPDGHGFVGSDGKAFVPFGVTYFRPGTGWAPQVWKQFDAEATRRDFAALKAMGANTVRVFLSFGSFFPTPDRVDPEGLAKFDQFLALAEEAGLYVHPTGPDHWEGLPAWAQGDRVADEPVLQALELFWKQFAARYRGRTALFAYDLLNEPEVRWNTPAMLARWNAWLVHEYGSAEKTVAAWTNSDRKLDWGAVAIPAKDAPPSVELRDFQHCREAVAVEWTRRQAVAIRAVDPEVLVTVGLIQSSVPVSVAGPWHYAAFRPDKLAPLLDFMEVHFYPLAHGFYDYRNADDETRNLAYLDSVVRAVARRDKPTVIAEFGWYGGGKPTIDQGQHAFASEEQQARWSRLVVEQSAGLATGWLNWAFHDHPAAGDVTEFIGLLTSDGRVKAWGREFTRLARQFGTAMPAPSDFAGRPEMNWDELTVSGPARERFQVEYLEAFRKNGKR